jgi:hypothetical protein
MAGRAGLILAALALSCGGGAAGSPEPATSQAVADPPAQQDEPAVAPEPTSESPETDAPGDTAGGDSDAPAATTTPEGDTLKAAVQALLDDPDLGNYLHLDKPGRLPIKVAGAALPSKLDVHKGGRVVEVVKEPDSPKAAVLVFTRVEQQGNLVRLRYRYDIEGIRGSATVARKDGRWLLTSNRVLER